jgi:hypothetical protein
MTYRYAHCGHMQICHNEHISYPNGLIYLNVPLKAHNVNVFKYFIVIPCASTNGGRGSDFIC